MAMYTPQGRVWTRARVLPKLNSPSELPNLYGMIAPVRTMVLSSTELPRRAAVSKDIVSALVAAARRAHGEKETIPMESHGGARSKRLRLAFPLAAGAILAAALILWPREPVQRPRPTGLPVVTAPVLTSVTVHAYPWAEVILDGETIGLTPRANPFQIPVGSHRLVLRNPHLGERVIDLDLEEGRPETVSVDLAEAIK